MPGKSGEASRPQAGNSQDIKARIGRIPPHIKDEIDLLRSKDGYLNAGMPRFMGLFGRDSIASSLQLMDYDSSIARSTLVALARLQGTRINPDNMEAPGKILHEYYPPETDPRWFVEEKGSYPWLKMGAPAYFSVDSTPLFLMLFNEYARRFRDDMVVQSLNGNAIRAAEWIVDYGMRDGLVRYDKPPSPEKGRLSQSWKDGAWDLLDQVPGPVAIIEVQGYAYKALTDFSSIVAETSIGYDISRLQSAASELKSNLDRFWIPDKEYYAIGIDGKDEILSKAITSNPGHLLSTGIIGKERAKKIVNRLFADDIMTPYGVRTYSTLEPDFDERSYQRGNVWIYDNWMIAQGLRAMEFNNEYSRLRNGAIAAYSESGESLEFYGVGKDGRMIPPELMSEMPCSPQAWTAGAFADFLMDGQ